MDLPWSKLGSLAGKPNPRFRVGSIGSLSGVGSADQLDRRVRLGALRPQLLRVTKAGCGAIYWQPSPAGSQTACCDIPGQPQPRPSGPAPSALPCAPVPEELLSLFHPAVANWFADSFVAPTPAQAEAWPAIKAGRHTLIAAPTGSGKTLAAFLAAIDELVRQGLEGRLTDATHVVYVSPLKALSNDIHRNLEAPLAGIREQLRQSGLPEVEIRTWVRTGDTPSSERARMRRTAAHSRNDPGIALRSHGFGVGTRECWRPPGPSSSTKSTRWRRTSAARTSRSRSRGSRRCTAIACSASACRLRKIRSTRSRISWSAPIRTAGRPRRSRPSTPGITPARP